MTQEDSLSGQTTLDQQPKGRRPVAQLVVVKGPSVGQRFNVENAVEIGRSPDASILIDHEQASRIHARVWRDPSGAFKLEDLGSRNGTFINGMRVQRRTLAYGDRIQIGAAVELEFSVTNGVDTQLAQRQRFEAIGRLGIGMAHDLHSVVSAVDSGAAFLRGLAGHHRLDEPEVQECLSDLALAAARTATFARTLMDFASGQPTQREVIDLSDLCNEVLNMMQTTVGAEISVETDFAPLLLVNGNRAELLQVVLNLCLNARDAMPYGGKLGIRAALAPRPQNSETRAGSARRAILSISDSGIGMGDETKKQLFEPFFTTKVDGVGYGLGLATALEIVSRHGGTIEVHSALGRGARFNVFLPAVDPGQLPHTRTNVERAVPNLRLARILVVDEDSIIRRMLARLLRRSGFEVSEVGSAKDALQQGLKTPVDVVIVDSRVAGSGVQALHQSLTMARPELKTIVVCRQVEPELQMALRGRNDLCILRKPFTFEQLVTVIDRILQEPSIDVESGPR
jgi:two-component system cell cycle sensor histidine kinase/response regulator CckA